MDTKKLTELFNRINPAYLNPLQCNLSFMHCNSFIYFLIGFIALYTIWIVFFSSKYSKISLLMTISCLGILFIGSSLLLLNMCVLKKPDMYSYIILGITAVFALLIFSLFRPSSVAK